MTTTPSTSPRSFTYGHVETSDPDRGIDDRAWLSEPRKAADDDEALEDDTVAVERELALFELPR